MVAAATGVMLAELVKLNYSQASHPWEDRSIVGSAISTAEVEAVCVQPVRPGDPGYDGTSIDLSDAFSLIASTLYDVRGWQNVGGWQTFLDFQVHKGCKGEYEDAENTLIAWAYPFSYWYDSDLVDNDCSYEEPPGSGNLYGFPACAKLKLRTDGVDPRTGHVSWNRLFIVISDGAFADGARPVNHEMGHMGLADGDPACPIPPQGDTIMHSCDPPVDWPSSGDIDSMYTLTLLDQPFPPSQGGTLGSCGRAFMFSNC